MNGRKTTERRRHSKYWHTSEQFPKKKANKANANESENEEVKPGAYTYSRSTRPRGHFLLDVRQLLQPYLSLHFLKRRARSSFETKKQLWIKTSRDSLRRTIDSLPIDPDSCPFTRVYSGRGATTKSLTLPGSTQTGGHQQRLRSNPDPSRPGGKHKHQPHPDPLNRGSKSEKLYSTPSHRKSM